MLRFHSDNSLEFYAKATRRWIKMNGMRMTASEGGVPQSNGFAERTVKWAKQRARVLLKSADLAPEFWPFAVQAAAAQQRSEVLGFTTKMAARFGAKVLVKQKPYDERGTVAKPDNLKSQWLDGKYLGLSDTIPHGHLVFVQGDRLMFIHTLHVRARLHDPGPPAEELEVSLVPRRIRGKRPPEEPASNALQARGGARKHGPRNVRCGKATAEAPLLPLDAGSVHSPGAKPAMSANSPSALRGEPSSNVGTRAAGRPHRFMSFKRTIEDP